MHDLNLSVTGSQTHHMSEQNHPH